MSEILSLWGLWLFVVSIAVPLYIARIHTTTREMHRLHAQVLDELAAAGQALQKLASEVERSAARP